ncbi:MAG: undecaprenyl-diphosphate phosphatase [Pseudomonadota bacterium]
MDLGQLILLAIVQGITEFLPISSSGHLVLAPKLFGAEDQGVLIDVALHLGSLGAVLLYFWRDVQGAIIGPFTLVGDLSARRALSWESKLALLLIVATIPVVLVGLGLAGIGAFEQIRTIEVIGWTTLLYGLALYVADRFSPQMLELKDWTFGGAIILGLAQALALIPGTSRSGVCMTAARFLGFSRVEAARVALLMAVPAILAASAKGAYDLYKSGDAALTLNAGIAAAFAFISAYAALAVMMRMLRSVSFTPFVIYRILLGSLLLWIAYG